MGNISYSIDDFQLAHNFIEKLPPMIRGRRFAIDLFTKKAAAWTPTHVVLALVKDRPVAMADCLIGEDNKAANGSLVSTPEFGAAAIFALLKMKTIFRVPHWESTLANPNKSNILISRRFFDSTYDQSTWDLSQLLMQKHGQLHYLQPTPIIISSSTLKHFCLPRIRDLNTSSIDQLIFVANDPMS